jgi:hypothetical protein
MSLRTLVNMNRQLPLKHLPQCGRLFSGIRRQKKSVQMRHSIYREAAMWSTTPLSHLPCPVRPPNRKRLQTIWSDGSRRTHPSSSITCQRFNGLRALNHNEPTKAIELLQTATFHELAVTGSTFFAFFGMFYPVYFRGEAYLAAHQGAEAAKQFQTILNHRRLAFDDPIGALARLQLARPTKCLETKSKRKQDMRIFSRSGKMRTQTSKLFRKPRRNMPRFDHAASTYKPVHRLLSSLPSWAKSWMYLQKSSGNILISFADYQKSCGVH